MVSVLGIRFEGKFEARNKACPQTTQRQELPAVSQEMSPEYRNLLDACLWSSGGLLR